MFSRTILHCDLNNFFASVECLYRPQLKDVPMAVCGSTQLRHGIVLAKNEAAKKCGVKTAEAIWQAKKKCPCLETVAPSYDRYMEFSRKAREIYARYTDMVEPFGADECWLDVSGSDLLFGDGESIADEIRRTVKKELGLTISVGVSFNKVFAKLGSDIKKPDAVTVITRDSFKRQVWPLAVEEMIGVGGSIKKALNGVGIYTLGELAGTTPEFLSLILGKAGRALYSYANGLDASPVISERLLPAAKSYGRSATCRYDLTDELQVKRVMLAMSEKVAHCLREDRVMAGLIQISVKDSDMCVHEHQKRPEQPTRLVEMLLSSGMELFNSYYTWEKPVRAVGIRACELVNEEDAIQYTLFYSGERYEKLERLESRVDEIRRRYGKQAIVRAGIMTDLPFGAPDVPAFALTPKII